MKLQAFLYSLMRDELPTGTVRRLIDDVQILNSNSPPLYSSPELAALADRYAKELQ